MVETVESVTASPKDDETREDKTQEPEAEESVTELLEQLGEQMSMLAFHEARVTASRHKPALYRAARDIAVALTVGLAFLTAFGLANAAAVHALSTAVADWAAALVLAAAWAAVGALLVLFLWGRARRLADRRMEDAEEARAEAGRAVRETVERLAHALSKAIALAAVPMAGEVAGGVVEASEEIIESADEMIEELVEDIPGGGVVNQMWDVVLMPGRLGIRVATTVLKRGQPDSDGDNA